MKHNQVIANIHFKKWWQRYVRTWFDQAGRKNARQEKAAKTAPRPTAGLLKPIVKAPTKRYNTKARLGRGFTLEELKAAGISKKLAPTVGIAVDHRRKNRCTESLQENASRLKLYKSKLLVIPRKSKAKKGDATRAEVANVAQNTLKEIIPLPKLIKKEKARAPTAAEKASSPTTILRTAWANKHYAGKKERRALLKEQAAQQAK